VASAYSVRPTPDARVSAPLTWDELASCEPGEFTLRSMPKRFAEIGDRHAGIDAQPGSLERLLELSARQEHEGHGDAPWPPHYEKQAGEPARVRPSAARKPRADDAAPGRAKRRVSKHPLIEIGRSPKKEEALAGFERWKARHPEAAAHLTPTDLLVDAMRGRFTTWTRVRVNLQHVPPEQRPAQAELDPNDEPNEWVSVAERSRRRPSPARKPS
jgi:hypothetical protein